MIMFRLLTALILSFIVVVQPGIADADDCQSWQQLRPYLQKFYQLEKDHKNNLIGHFNVLPPRTDLQPDKVGYSWFAGEKLVRLYMISGDCVVLNRYYPRDVVWKLMGTGPGSGLDFDKSGESYAQALAERNAARDKAWKKSQQQKQMTEEESMSEEEQIQNQDIN